MSREPLRIPGPARSVVGEGGLEPPRPEGHWHLKPARLPFRHSPERPRERITLTGSLPNPLAPPTCTDAAPPACATGSAGLPAIH